MFLSGSFAVTLQCSHQCDHSVPGSEIFERTKVMYQRCSRSVHLQCPGSVPAVYRFWENLGKFWGHCKHISNVPIFAVFLVCAFSVPRISPNFPKSGTLQEHSQDTANVLIWNIFGTSLWFFQNFSSQVHCDHTDGNTAKSLQMSHSGTSLVLSLANLKVYPQFT